MFTVETGNVFSRIFLSFFLLLLDEMLSFLYCVVQQWVLKREKERKKEILLFDLVKRVGACHAHGRGVALAAQTLIDHRE